MKTNLLFLSVLFLGVVTLLAFSIPQEQKKGAKWDVPAKYKEMKNPAKGDAESIKLGKALYAKHCRSCHGNAGLGDGPKAKNLETYPGDFSDAAIQAHSDGELYYMSVVGRDEMPNFEKNLPDEESRWAVINYIRSFKK
ncbi:MAG: c-type cytochrome [Bacteroidetes bacterium]|nr:c-type cytochrome [Bacteroidota bacterium]